MNDPIGQLLLGGVGRIRAVEIEYQERAAFEMAAAILELEVTGTTRVASGYVDGVEIVLVLEDGPAT